MRYGPLTRFLKFHHLQLVIALDDLRNMGRAADYLGLTQPAVSRSLHDLEAQLGSRLFERSARGTIPTPAGEALVEFARATLVGLTRIGTVIDDLDVGDRPHVRIGTAILAGSARIVQGIRQMRASNRDAIISVSEGMTENLLQRLRLGELDLVVARVDRVDQMREFRVSPLFEEATAVIASLDLPLLDGHVCNWTLATSLPWALAPRTSALRQRFDAFLLNGELPYPDDIIEVESWMSALTLVRQLSALSLVPESFCVYFEKLGLIRRVPLSLFEDRRTVGIIELPSRQSPSSVGDLIRIFRDASRQNDS